MKIYAEITKVDDEQRLVYGYATTEALDSQGERVTKAAVEAALPDYMRFANVREMHQPSAVGVAKEATIDDKGLYLVCKVVAEDAWQKVKEGVYKGFSIGGKMLSKVGDEITGLRLTEISLVDRPANPEAVFDCWKADGAAPELTDEQALDELAAVMQGNAMKPADLLRIVRAELGKADAAGDGAADQVAGEEVEAAKLAPVAEVKKGMYGVAQFAAIMSNIADLQASSAWEAGYEGDMSDMPGKLKAWMSEGADLLQAMAAEESDELIAEADGGEGAADAVVVIEQAEQAGDVGKAGARHSKSDMAHVQGMHDSSVKLGAKCDAAEKADSAAGLEKADEIAKAIADGVEKATAEARELMQKMADRIKALEDQPMPAKGVLRAVSKGEDSGTGAAPASAPAPVLKTDGSVDDVATMIKSIHARGGRPLEFGWTPNTPQP